MTANSSAYPEILCIRVPKGTEKRIRALCRKLKLRRPDLLRQAMDEGLRRAEGRDSTVFAGLDGCITTGKGDLRWTGNGDFAPAKEQT